MEIIDFKQKGNIVRFFLGENGEQWGDDWNDRPYDCNAGEVYDRYVKGYKDLSFPFDELVLQPCDGVLNCEYAKEDMVKRRVPCIIVVPKELAEDYYWSEDFEYFIGYDGVTRYYFGDDIGEPDVLLKGE